MHRYPYSALVRSILISFVILLLTYLAFGMYLEDNEAIVSAINYGLFGRLGTEQYASDYQTFFLPILYHLSQFFQRLPIYGIWKFLYALLTLTAIIYYLISELEINKRDTALNIAIGVILIVILTIDSFFYAHCVRISILLGFAALAINWQSLDSKGRSSRFALLIFILSVISRMHSAVIILSVFIAFHVLRGISPLVVLKRHAAMIFIGFSFVFAYQLYGFYTTNFGKYIEANYEYAIIEKASLYPLSTMKTREDSVKYQALQQFFITDSSQFTKQFFLKAVNLNYHQKFSWDNLHLRTIFKELVSKFRQLTYMPVLLVFLVGIFALSHKGKKELIQSALLLSLTLAAMAVLLFMLVDEIKMRFFSPYTGMTIFLLFMIYYPGFLEKANKTTRSIALLVLVLLLLLKGKDIYAISIQEKEKEQKIAASASRLQAYFVKYPTLIFMGADIPFRSALFYRPAPDLYGNMASFDGAYLIYFSYARDKFDRLFAMSPLDYSALIRLFEQRGDLRFYAVPERLELVRLYFKTLYHVDLIFEKESPQPPLGLNGMMYSVKVNRAP